MAPAQVDVRLVGADEAKVMLLQTTMEAAWCEELFRAHRSCSTDSDHSPLAAGEGKVMMEPPMQPWKQYAGHTLHAVLTMTDNDRLMTNNNLPHVIASNPQHNRQSSVVTAAGGSNLQQITTGSVKHALYRFCKLSPANHQVCGVPFT